MTPQPLQALAKANEIRSARAELRARLRIGAATAVEVLEDEAPADWLAGMAVIDVLAPHYGWGKPTARKVLASAGVSELRRIGDLSLRDRYRLVDAIEGRL